MSGYVSTFVVVLLLTVSQIRCDDEIDIEKLKSQLPEGVLPANFNASALPSADDVKKIIIQKCEQVSNREAYDNVEVAATDVKDCIMGLVDFEELQKEIDEAQPNGELDTVFNKYCRKRTIAIECMRNFSTAMEPCLSQEEIAHKKTFVNIFTNLLNFVCHKDGDQIALFIAEKGPECFSDRKDALVNCINTTMASYLPTEAPSLDNLPQLVMGVEQCNDMNRLQYCVVKELEECEETTPANLVESMFKFVRNETPCANMTTSARTQKNSADSHQSTMTTTVMGTLVMAIMSKVFV